MFEPLAALDEIRARRPCEVVHVFLDSSGGSLCRPDCRCARARGRLPPVASRAAPSCARRRRRSRKRTPFRRETDGSSSGRRLQHADLRKPLPEKVVVADDPGSRERARNLRGERDVERDVWPGPTGAGSVTAITVRSSSFPSSGAMKRIACVRSTGATAPPVILRLDMSIAANSSARSRRRRISTMWSAGARASMSSRHSATRCSRGETAARWRDARDVRPDERLARGKRARTGVQPYVDCVIRVARRECLRSRRTALVRTRASTTTRAESRRNPTHPNICAPTHPAPHWTAHEGTQRPAPLVSYTDAFAFFFTVSGRSG